MQTLRLDRILHEIRLGNNRRDSQTHRNSHTAQRLRIVREILVPTTHVARVEVRTGSLGREIQRVDARLREHQNPDADRLSPDAVQVVPGRVARGAVGEERREHVPHLVHFRLDVAVHPGFEVVRLRHVDYRFGAGEEEGPSDRGRDRAHELAAVGGDFVVVGGAEAAEEHGTEGEVYDLLVDYARD